MSIVIDTPNGNIGRASAEQLFAVGESITVISRTADRAAPLVAQGARLVQGAIDDRDRPNKCSLSARYRQVFGVG